MSKHPKYYNVAIIIQIIVIACIPIWAKENTLIEPNIKIRILSTQESDSLHPYEELQIEFEIENSSEENVTILSENDIVLSLNNGKKTVYERSLQLPKTSETLLEEMRVKRKHNSPQMITIVPATSRQFTFNSYNSLPLLEDSVVWLSVSAQLESGTRLQSEPRRLNIQKFKTLTSSRTLLYDYSNVYINPTIIEIEKRRKIALYYSVYPIFNKIDTYYHYDKYPNYESLIAFLPCGKSVQRVEPVFTYHTNEYDMQLALISDNEMLIVKVPTKGLHIQTEYEKIMSLNLTKLGHVENVMRCYVGDRLIYLLQIKENDQTRLCYLEKKLLSWKLFDIKKKIEFEELIFGNINLSDFTK